VHRAVANVIVSLLSDEWSYVTGQCINVNGGQFMLQMRSKCDSCSPLRSRVLLGSLSGASLPRVYPSIRDHQRIAQRRAARQRIRRHATLSA
jgi:hypothetical protein